MPKYYGFIIAILSIVGTALFIGWKNNLDYWRRIHTINCEITRPANESHTDPMTASTSKETAAPADVNADKPTDRETVDGWLAWAKAARGRDPNWMPQTYTRLGEIKGVQSCAIEFTVLQIDDSTARIISHNGERLWLTGHPGADRQQSLRVQIPLQPGRQLPIQNGHGGGADNARLPVSRRASRILGREEVSGRRGSPVREKLCC